MTVCSSFSSRPTPRPCPNHATTMVYHPTEGLQTIVVYVTWTAGGNNDVTTSSLIVSSSGNTSSDDVASEKVDSQENSFRETSSLLPSVRQLKLLSVNLSFCLSTEQKCRTLASCWLTLTDEVSRCCSFGRQGAHRAVHAAT